MEAGAPFFVTANDTKQAAMRTVCYPISLQNRTSLPISCTIFAVSLAQIAEILLYLQYHFDITLPITIPIPKTMKTTLLLCCLVSVVMLILAVIVLKGHGDRLVSSYRYLTDEEKARVNVGRMRIVSAATLVFVAVLIPVNALATTDFQHLVTIVVTIVGILALILALHFWAGVPLRSNIRRK